MSIDIYFERKIHIKEILNQTDIEVCYRRDRVLLRYNAGSVIIADMDNDGYFTEITEYWGGRGLDGILDVIVPLLKVRFIDDNFFEVLCQERMKGSFVDKDKLYSDCTALYGFNAI